MSGTIETKVELGGVPVDFVLKRPTARERSQELLESGVDFDGAGNLKGSKEQIQKFALIRLRHCIVSPSQYKAENQLLDLPEDVFDHLLEKTKEVSNVSPRTSGSSGGQ